VPAVYRPPAGCWNDVEDIPAAMRPRTRADRRSAAVHVFVQPSMMNVWRGGACGEPEPTLSPDPGAQCSAWSNSAPARAG